MTFYLFSQEKIKPTIGKIGQYSSQPKNAHEYAYGNNEKVGNYDRYENQVIVSNNNYLDYCQWIIVSELWYEYFELW